MALTSCNAVTNVISSLPDEPSITATELKAAFDAGADNVKDWINDTHLTEVDNALSGKSDTDHTHDTRYYQKSDTYSKAEADAKFTVITTGTSAPVGLSEGEIYLRYKE